MWDTSDVVFMVLFTGSALIMLYAIALIHNKLRLIEYELQALKKDQVVMSDELELVASVKSVGKKAS